jgi:cellulose synthase/poly-beta-1,6-N-acetylglucosamine synthase-like glycosyltransferase
MKETIRKHIISWVEENIYSLANIDDLTKVLGYSRRTIETWFKQQYGQSLGDYILKRRICRAAVLIRMTSLPITEIAYLFHYQSSQGFARAFKKFTGLSPTDYRRSDVWEFDKLQSSLLLKDVQLPEVELCTITREFAYNHTVTVHDHIFEPAVSDVTKSIKKLLLESEEVIKELAISAKHSALLSKGRGTGFILNRLAKQHLRLRVIHLAHNQGKAIALKTGVAAAKSEWLVCIDGDAKLDRDAVAYIVAPMLENPRVGAVTGNPRIRTRSTLIGKIQVGEFSSIIGMIKRTQRMYGQIFTISGVVAAFRRTALADVGYWSEDIITEDIDISWKLQLKHWSIFYEPRALCWVLMPETLKG